VNLSNLLKQLKKRLRRPGRSLALGGWIFAIGSLFIAFAIGNEAKPVFEQVASEVLEKPQHYNVIDTLRKLNGTIEVTMEKRYICGKKTLNLGRKTTTEIIHLLKSHSNLTAGLTENGSIILIENIDDLAPECIGKAYISVDYNGKLVLFEGEKQHKKAVRTFFQLNVGQMESSLPKETVRQLYDGIKINDYDEYNSVLSTFSDYAVD
jgi:forespore regulator of the sigma-K checkpoint